MSAIETIKAQRAAISARFHVRRIGVFGSHARGAAHAGSDVDVLVEFEPGHATFDNYMGLKFLLEEAFHAKVDLVTSDAVKPRLRDAILSEVTYA